MLLFTRKKLKFLFFDMFARRVGEEVKQTSLVFHSFFYFLVCPRFPDFRFALLQVSFHSIRLFEENQGEQKKFVRDQCTEFGLV